jgi:hypothetical protein
MIVILPIDCTASGILVDTNATDATAWSNATTYAVDDVISYANRNWISVQAANLNKTPGSEPLWWVDNGPTNSLAMFDSSVQTKTTTTGGLTFTVKSGRATAIGLMGLIGNELTITVRDGYGGDVIYTMSKTLQIGAGTYYGFCFSNFVQQSDICFTGILGTYDGHMTISIDGSGETSCGLCVIGQESYIGEALHGFSFPLEDRGRQYLDSLGNPVTVERGYSRGCSGSVSSDKKSFNRLMTIYQSMINTPCLWVAAPGISEYASALVFGKLSQVTPVIESDWQIVTSLSISGYR